MSIDAAKCDEQVGCNDGEVSNSTNSSPRFDIPINDKISVVRVIDFGIYYNLVPETRIFSPDIMEKIQKKCRDVEEKEMYTASVDPQIRSLEIPPLGIPINEIVSIITSDGRNFVGTMKGFDQTINIILDDSHERVYSSQGIEQINLGLHIIRGDNVAVIGEIDEEVDGRLDMGTIKADPLQAIIH